MSRFVALRAGYGVVLLLQPDQVIRLYTGHPADRTGMTVARLLGARHLMQALLTLGRPGAMVLVLGVEADIAHSASMLGLAALDRRRRRGALVDAATAGSFAIAGAVLAWWRCVDERSSASPAPSTRLGTGRAVATWIATRTFPSAMVRALLGERGPMPDDPDDPDDSAVAAQAAVHRADHGRSR